MVDVTLFNNCYLQALKSSYRLFSSKCEDFDQRIHFKKHRLEQVKVGLWFRFVLYRQVNGDRIWKRWEGSGIVAGIESTCQETWRTRWGDFLTHIKCLYLQKKLGIPPRLILRRKLWNVWYLSWLTNGASSLLSCIRFLASHPLCIHSQNQLLKVWVYLCLFSTSLILDLMHYLIWYFSNNSKKLLNEVIFKSIDPIHPKILRTWGRQSIRLLCIYK